MVEASAAPVQESLEAFMRRVREAVGTSAVPGKHAAPSRRALARLDSATGDSRR